MDEHETDCLNYPQVLKCKIDNNFSISQLHVCPKDSKLPLPDEMQPQRILHPLYGIISNELLSGDESTEYIDIGYTWKLSFIQNRALTVFGKILQLYEEKLSNETVSYKTNETTLIHDLKKKNFESTEKCITGRNILATLSINSKPSPVSSLLSSTDSDKLENKKVSLTSIEEGSIITSSAGFRIYFQELIDFSSLAKNKLISVSKIDTYHKEYLYDVTNYISIGIKDLITDIFSTKKSILFRSNETYSNLIDFFDSTNKCDRKRITTKSMLKKRWKNQFNQKIKSHPICANAYLFKFNSFIPYIVFLNNIKYGLGRCYNTEHLHQASNDPIKFLHEYSSTDIETEIDRCCSKSGSFRGVARNVFDVATFNEIEKTIIKSVGFKGSASKNAIIKTVAQERRYNILERLMKKEKLFFGAPIGTMKQLFRKAFEKDQFVTPICNKEQKILQINKLNDDHIIFYVGPKVVSLLSAPEEEVSSTIVLHTNSSPIKSSLKHEKNFNLHSFRTPLLNTYIKPLSFEEPKTSKLFNQLWR